MLYGYRGLIVEWDYTGAVDSPTGVATTAMAYRLNGEDEASFPDEVDCRPDDFHRHYCPYRRLVGVDVVERFNRMSTPAEANVELRGSSSLAEFVRRLQGSSYARDQIQPVYRPISMPPPTDSAAAHYNHQRTGSGDDWFAMVDNRDRSVASQAQQLHLMPEYPTTANVTVLVTPSSPLPVVPEVSAEDHPNDNGTEVNQEPASQRPVMNGHHVTGNGKVDHYVSEPEVVDNGAVRVKKPTETTITTTTTVVTHSTTVPQVNGDALNTSVNDNVADVPVNGSAHIVECTTELPSDGADAMKTPTSGYIIDETNRRTIRSDL